MTVKYWEDGIRRASSFQSSHSEQQTTIRSGGDAKDLEEVLFESSWQQSFMLFRDQYSKFVEWRWRKEEMTTTAWAQGHEGKRSPSAVARGPWWFSSDDNWDGDGYDREVEGSWPARQSISLINFVLGSIETLDVSIERWRGRVISKNLVYRCIVWKSASFRKYLGPGSNRWSHRFGTHRHGHSSPKSL